MTITVPSHLPYPLWNTEESCDSELRSNHGAALALLGYTLFCEKCPSEAVENFSQALTLMPESRSVREWRSMCYLEMGDYAKALADLDDVVRLFPQYSMAYNNRGVLYFFMDRLDEALADLNTAIALNPEHGRAYTNRAQVYCSLGQYAQAQQNCNMGRLLDGDSDEVTAAQARIFENSLKVDTTEE